MPPEPGGRTLWRAGGSALLLAAAAAVISLQLWHGPTLLTLSAEHGIDTGDLVAVPFLLTAIAVARRQPVPPPSSGWALPVSALTLGAVLLFASHRLYPYGAADTVRIIAAVAAAGLFVFLIATMHFPRTAIRRRTWWLPLVLFALGSLADAASFPLLTMAGPVLVALWMAATAAGRIERACLWVAAGVFAGVTLTALADLGKMGDVLARFHAGTARSMALGALFVTAGIATRSSRLHRRTSAG